MAFFATKGAKLMENTNEGQLYTPSWFTAPLTSPPPMLVVSTPEAVFNPVDEQRIHERVRDFLSGKTPCLVLPAGYIAQRIN